jgi:hypothetical protein
VSEIDDGGRACCVEHGHDEAVKGKKSKGQGSKRVDRGHRGSELIDGTELNPVDRQTMGRTPQGTEWNGGSVFMIYCCSHARLCRVVSLVVGREAQSWLPPCRCLLLFDGLTLLFYFLCAWMCAKNSCLVLASFWKQPSTDEVTVVDDVFSTPLICIHR